jgi:putative exporter of polyketide antibiotics
MSRVHLRKDVMDIMLWQLKCGCFDSVTTSAVRTAMFNRGLKTILTEQVMNGGRNELFVKPLADTFTFGLYSSVFCTDD